MIGGDDARYNHLAEITKNAIAGGHLLAVANIDRVNAQQTRKHDRVVGYMVSPLLVEKDRSW